MSWHNSKRGALKLFEKFRNAVKDKEDVKKKMGRSRPCKDLGIEILCSAQL